MSLEKSLNELPALKKKGKLYDLLAVKKIVEAIEGGMPRSEICVIYGLARSTVCMWMRDHGSEAYKASQGGRLNNAQKRSMVRAIREGRMTMREAKLTYNMKSYTAILNLLRQEGENVDLSDDMKSKANTAAKGQEDAENKALRLALEEAELKIKALNTLIDVAEDQFKIPIRKKPGAKQSKP
jgi:transposase-like protein